MNAEESHPMQYVVPVVQATAMSESDVYVSLSTKLLKHTEPSPAYKMGFGLEYALVFIFPQKVYVYERMIELDWSRHLTVIVV